MLTRGQRRAVGLLVTLLVILTIVAVASALLSGQAEDPALEQPAGAPPLLG